jgi:hypothetical protein
MDIEHDKPNKRAFFDPEDGDQELHKSITQTPNAAVPAGPVKHPVMVVLDHETWLLLEEIVHKRRLATGRCTRKQVIAEAIAHLAEADGTSATIK